MTGSRPSVRQHGRTETHRVSRDNAQPDSSPETSVFRGLRAVRISAEATRLLMSSCNSGAGTVNQRLFGARGLSMRGETIRRDLRERRPRTRPRHSAGPPRELSTHATSCRKTPYARRKTRTPRPGGQGVHSEPAGASIWHAPLEVVRAEQASNRKLGFGSLGGLDDPSWDAQNGDFDP